MLGLLRDFIVSVLSGCRLFDQGFLTAAVRMALVLAICSGTASRTVHAAGVDAQTVDAQVRCAFPVFLATAVREYARQERIDEACSPESPYYSWCAVDLNNDGGLEVLYKSGFCGMGGCMSQVLAWHEAKLIPLGEIGPSHDGPIIGKRRHRAWRDLYIFQKTTSTSFSILVPDRMPDVG